MAEEKKKRGAKLKLTPETQEAITKAIRGGCFDYTAAEVAGISQRTFYYWLEKGEEQKSGEFHDFALGVMMARAQARVEAEAIVFKTDPFKWLRYGPGRERPGRPGWGDTIAVAGADGGPLKVGIIKTEWGRAAKSGPPPREASLEPMEEPQLDAESLDAAAASLLPVIGRRDDDDEDEDDEEE
jgi:hypothetical protein